MTNNEYKEMLKKAHLGWYAAFCIFAAINITVGFLIEFETGVALSLFLFIAFVLFYVNTIKGKGTAWATWVLYSSPIHFGISSMREWLNTPVFERTDLCLGFIILGSALAFYLWHVAKVRQLNRIAPLFAKFEATS